MTLELKCELPPASGFVSLRQDTDWGPITLAQAEASLSASLCGISIYDSPQHGSKLIGMSRVIGDGILNLYIQDVIIAKDYRGQGLGERVMQLLIKVLKDTYPHDCTIGLMAAKDQSSFYTRFGFQPRPSQTVDAGMTASLSQLS